MEHPPPFHNNGISGNTPGEDGITPNFLMFGQKNSHADGPHGQTTSNVPQPTMEYAQHLWRQLARVSVGRGQAGSKAAEEHL